MMNFNDIIIQKIAHYLILSMSSTNNLSDIGKAKLNSTLLSSSKVTKPSPRLSNAAKARLMFP